jgi:hypothetical protein
VSLADDDYLQEQRFIERLAYFTPALLAPAALNGKQL